MKKLASVNKSMNKGSYCTNLKSNRDQLKSSKQRSGIDFVNNSSSSTVICTSIDAKKNNTYMSNHIKRMLNGSLNSSNPSIYGNKNKGKMPLSKQIREYKVGPRGKTAKNSTSRQVNFNNTQKINIEEHLDGMKAFDDLNHSKLYNESIHNNLKKNSSSNKFRLILNKNKDNTSKYSYLAGSGYNRGLERHLAEYKAYSNKTPSHNSRVIQKGSGKSKNKISDAYYKKERKVNNYPHEQQKEHKLWKNMTQKDIFGNENVKLSGISPSSTKNCTSHYMKFNFDKEPNINDPNLELPDGLKDLEDSDLEVEDYDDPHADNTGEGLSLEENNPKCFTKSKIELFQTNIKENHFNSKIQTGKYMEKTKKKPAAQTILPNQDTVDNIEFVNHDKNMTSNVQKLKEKIGDYIDSSGGTIDAVEYAPPEEESQAAVPEIQTLNSITNNYTNIKEINNEKQMKKIQEDSGDKAKRRLKELTKLDGKNCKKDETIDYPMKAGQALRNFMGELSDYEKGEILDYKRIWFLGLEADKIDGSPLKPYNYGYDDDKGDYKVVLKDHIGYRFEVIEPLGKGSFGQALR